MQKALQTFRRYHVAFLPKQYVSGESYHYLGRQLRLKVHTESTEPAGQIWLDRQFLHIAAPGWPPAEIGAALQDWYSAQARAVFAARLDALYPKIAPYGVDYPKLVVRPMTQRWGSCSVAGTLTLNVKLVRVAQAYIDYVVLHELCHLQYLSHGQDFYGLLARVCPDWEERRRGLNVGAVG